MIADLKPYPKYKASSQAWLGDVPQHWSLMPNRALFAEVKDRNHPVADVVTGKLDVSSVELPELDEVEALAEQDEDKSNAGAYYTKFFNRLDKLSEIDWEAVTALDFRASMIKEGKQAEFLVFDDFPWQLIERIGVINQRMEEQVAPLVNQTVQQPTVSVQPDWYY